MAKAVPFAAMLLIVVAGCGKKAAEPVAGTGSKDSGNAATKPSKPALSKLVVTDTVVGKGPEAANGDMIWVRYTGKLADDTVFDSSAQHDNKPFNFTLGEGGVIEGWEKGMVGMRPGGKRTLGIPWSMGYGKEGHPPTIPAKADLYFDVELLDLVKSDETDVIERKSVKPGTGREAKDGDTVTVTYVGKLVSGEVFDERYKDKPYTFKLGDEKVRPFFHAAVRGMRAGGERKVKVPPEVGFGDTGGPNVGPNEILYFDVKVLSVK